MCSIHNTLISVTFVVLATLVKWIACVIQLICNTCNTCKKCNTCIVTLAMHTTCITCNISNMYKMCNMHNTCTVSLTFVMFNTYMYKNVMCNTCNMCNVFIKVKIWCITNFYFLKWPTELRCNCMINFGQCNYDVESSNHNNYHPAILTNAYNKPIQNKHMNM